MKSVLPVLCLSLLFCSAIPAQDKAGAAAKQKNAEAATEARGDANPATAKLPVRRVVLYKNGVGSLAYADSWNLFDQMILSPGLANGHGGRYAYYGARIFNKPYLQQDEGNFKGYPLRTYVGDQFVGGYSDHFPVFVILVRGA